MGGVLSNDATKASEDATKASEDAASVPTILIVEDEVLLRMAAADEFREQGYSVLEAANADEALSILRSGTEIHVILTDVRMPGSLDGIGLARVVRAECPEIDIVVTSGHLNCDMLEQIGQLAGFFPKPYDFSKLVAYIGSLFDGKTQSTSA